MCLTGFQEETLFHYETIEAEVGQNITLPCIVKNNPDFRTVSTEWNKKKNEITQLAVWVLGHGGHLFLPNVTIQVYKNEKDVVMGSYLHLYDVKKWDSGMYICEIKKFPYGSIVAKTELIIKGKRKTSLCNPYLQTSTRPHRT